MISIHSNIRWCFLLFISCSCARKQSQPNILFILADDLGYNDIGFHNDKVITPNINKLSNDGVKLENYYVQPICTPTRSQLLTGRYQIRTGLQHGVLWPPRPYCLPLDEVLLPQKLKEAGYSTHMIGKWHLGFYKKQCFPTRRGFDSFYGYYAGAEDYYTKIHSVKCDNSTFTGFDFRLNETVHHEAKGNYSAYQYRDRAVKLIESHNSEKPMFMYLAFQSVHSPLQAPDKYYNLYPNVTDKHRRHLLAMVTAMDDVIGDVVDSLKKRGMWENTLLVFSTDNGGQTLYGGNNFPLRGRKASLWEGGIKAVGFVHGVGVDGNGRVSRELMHVSDWMPTLLHIAGAKLNGTKPLDGVNNWSVLSSSQSKSNRKEILHNIDPLFVRPNDPQPSLLPYPNKHGVNTTTGHSAIRVGRWKLFTGDPGFDKTVPEPGLLSPPSSSESEIWKKYEPSVRLFDIEADPYEHYELSEYFPHIVDTLLGKIAAYNLTAVPVTYPPCDHRANPDLHGGVWTPWE